MKLGSGGKCVGFDPCVFFCGEVKEHLVERELCTTSCIYFNMTILLTW